MIKKLFTFVILTLLVMTASARQLYIFGDNPFGGWDLKFSSFTAFTLADDHETNTIEFTLEKEGWYVFTDGIETDDNWELWKASHRFIVNEVDGDVNPGEYNWTLKQVYGDESLHLLPGTYKITIVAGDAVTYETKKVYVDDQTGWETLKLYAWGDGQPQLFGGWWDTMGYTPSTETINGTTYKVYPFPANGNTYNEFIFSDNGSEEKRVILKSVVADKDYYLTLKTTNNDYTTFVASQDLEFTNVSGLTAYVAKDVSSEKVTLTEVDAVPVGTPLVLGGKGTFVIPHATSASAPASNLLKPGPATLTGDGTEYVLKDGKFHKASAGDIAVGKAYLKTSALAAELTLTFGDNETTAIKNVKVGSEDNTYHDLQGRRVLYPKKGLYIVNGKKVLFP